MIAIGYYNMTVSIISFQVSVENDFTDEYYNSSWSYMRHEEERKNIRGGHDHKTFHNKLKQDKVMTDSVFLTVKKAKQYKIGLDLKFCSFGLKGVSPSDNKK